MDTKKRNTGGFVRSNTTISRTIPDGKGGYYTERFRQTTPRTANVVRQDEEQSHKPGNNDMISTNNVPKPIEAPVTPPTINTRAQAEPNPHDLELESWDHMVLDSEGTATVRTVRSSAPMGHGFGHYRVEGVPVETEAPVIVEGDYGSDSEAKNVEVEEDDFVVL